MGRRALKEQKARRKQRQALTTQMKEVVALAQKVLDYGEITLYPTNNNPDKPDFFQCRVLTINLKREIRELRRRIDYI